MAIYRMRYVLELAVEADTLEDAVTAARQKMGPLEGVQVVEVQAVRWPPSKDARPEER